MRASSARYAHHPEPDCRPDDALIRDTQDRPAFRCKPCVSLRVMSLLSRIVVRPPIAFDDELARDTGKVGDVRSDWNLSAKFDPGRMNDCGVRAKGCLRRSSCATKVARSCKRSSGAYSRAWARIAGMALVRKIYGLAPLIRHTPCNTFSREREKGRASPSPACGRRWPLALARVG